MKLTKLKNAALSLLFPEKCACCLEIIHPDEGVCEACKENIDFIEDKRCLKCGMGEGYCECSFNVFRFDGVAAPFYNSGSIKRAIYNAKFRGHISVHRFFIGHMVEAFNKCFGEISFDGVTFVPAGRKRFLEHGYNQSEILAKGVAQKLNLPLLRLLKKAGKNKKQHGIRHFKERFENVNGAYEVSKKTNLKNVLLIDDIKTTGATLNECARLLKLGGAENVYCLTAAISNPRLKKVKK